MAIVCRGAEMSLWAKFKTMERGWRNGMGEDISTSAARRRARRHYLFIDHGILRVLWRNYHRVDQGVYRSNQPSPRRLEHFRDEGIKTILNLRGVGEHSHYLFEHEACRRLGMTLIDHRLYASDLASAEELLALEKLFRQMEKPFVMHCKSGADRTGFAAALYLIMIRDVPVDQAVRQLHWRYVHFKHSKNGILDFFFAAYQRAARGRNMSLSDWIRTQYDPVALRAEYHSKRKGRFFRTD